MTSKDPGHSLPTSVQNSYFLLRTKERDILNQALSKYRPGQSEPILIGGEKLLKTTLRRLPEYVSGKPANLELRSQYSIRFYDWVKKYVEARTKTISLEELRRVLGVESIKDAEGNVIKEAPLPVWANFKQRALDVAILEVNTKTDLKIKLASKERKHRRVAVLNFTIKTQAIPKAQPDRK